MNLIRAFAIGIVVLIVLGLFLRGQQQIRVPVGGLLIALVITLVVILVRDARNRQQ